MSNVAKGEDVCHFRETIVLLDGAMTPKIVIVRNVGFETQITVFWRGYGKQPLTANLDASHYPSNSVPELYMKNSNRIERKL